MVIPAFYLINIIMSIAANDNLFGPQTSVTLGSDTPAAYQRMSISEVVEYPNTYDHRHDPECATFPPPTDEAYHFFTRIPRRDFTEQLVNASSIRFDVADQSFLDPQPTQSISIMTGICISMSICTLCFVILITLL